MVTLIRTTSEALINVIQRHGKKLIVLATVLIALTIYANPQGFVNIWLTRDQQAMLAFNQGDIDRAAQTFSNESWIAYSYYVNGEFSQAVDAFKRLPGSEAQFAQANALAHSGEYFLAADIYKTLIEQDSQHPGAQQNLELMNELIEKQKNAPRNNNKKGQSKELAENKKLTEIEDQKKVTLAPPSHDLWLTQVQQDPSKFLRNKFSQEYRGANE